MVIWVSAFISLAIFFYVSKMTKRTREQKRDRRLERHLHFMEQLRNNNSGEAIEETPINTPK